MSDTWYKWRVWCETNQVYEYIISSTKPTTCPINPQGHTITSSLTTAIEKRDSNTVQVQEEFVETQGIYKFKGYKTTIPSGTPGTTTTIDLVWPQYAITLLNGEFDASQAQLGDEINARVVPANGGVVGALTAFAVVGDPLLHVTSTVTDNVLVGFNVQLFDGAHYNDCGICVAKDSGAGTITVETAPTYAFSPLSPSYVLMYVNIVESKYVASVGKHDFAKKKLGGKAIPKGTLVRLLYTNNDGVQKDFVYSLEMMY